MKFTKKIKSHLLLFFTLFAFGSQLQADESLLADKPTQRCVSWVRDCTFKFLGPVVDFFEPITNPILYNLDQFFFSYTAKEKKQIEKERLTRISAVLESPAPELEDIAKVSFSAGWWSSTDSFILSLVAVIISLVSLSSASIGLVSQIARAVIFVCGQVLSLTALGLIFEPTKSALFGFTQYFGFTVFSALLFLLLALSMLGFFNIRFKLGRFRIWGISSRFLLFIYGLVSGLIMLPTVTPYLSLVTTFVDKTDSLFLSLSTLGSFSLGLCILLFSIAVLFSFLVLFFRPIHWLSEVRGLFGFAILFLCLNLVAPFLVRYQLMLIFAFIFLAVAIYFFASSKKEAVLSVIQAHKESEHDESAVPGAWHVVSATIVIKKFLAYFALFWAVFFFARTYIVYNKTSVKRILIKSLS